MYCLYCCVRFNAVVPFLIVIIITFVGMVVGGYLYIHNNNKKKTNPQLVDSGCGLHPVVALFAIAQKIIFFTRNKQLYFVSLFSVRSISLSVTNIFGEGDAVAALIWANALAIIVLVVMLVAQRILTTKEVMECWVEGVKDIIEPLIILILAWGLGNVIAVSYWMVCHNTQHSIISLLLKIHTLHPTQVMSCV